MTPNSVVETTSTWSASISLTAYSSESPLPSPFKVSVIVFLGPLPVTVVSISRFKMLTAFLKKLFEI
ncbi:hypothetical protein AB7O20_01220 [Lentilactobacillus buchneri]|uniref:hypothetical protein n=1 Tax=Lentilactobacillus buchneri TaxID=1581 RepID=UPI0034E52375